MTELRPNDHDAKLDRALSCLLVAMTLLGAYYRIPLLVALGATVFATLRVARLWSGWCLHAVEYGREISDDRAFPGDELLLTLRLSNGKLLPLPWVEVDDRVSPVLDPAPVGDQPCPVGQDGRIRLAGSVSWYQRLVWRYRLHCRRRGIYPLGPAVVASGDPFGFFPRWLKVLRQSRVIVYPKLAPVSQLGLPPGFPLGENRAERWIFEDPSRTVGVRDYRREDPFRRIHWKASARRQELQVKLHEPTTTLEVALFLDVGGWGKGVGDAEKAQGTGHRSQGDGLTEAWSAEREVRSEDPARSTQHAALGAQDAGPRTRDSGLAFEHAVSLVASLAHLLIGQRHPVGLYINGGVAGSRDLVETSPGSSPEQLVSILELLAGVEAEPCVPMEELLGRLGPRLPWGCSVIVVAGDVSEPLLATLEAMRKGGRELAVLLAGEGQPPETVGGVPIVAADSGTARGNVVNF